MNIGFVVERLPYLPSRDGFRLYAGNLIRCLSGRHQIELISLLRGDDSQHLSWARQYCASVHTIAAVAPGFLRRAASFASSYLWGKPLHFRTRFRTTIESCVGEWDVMHVEGPFVAGLVPPQLHIPRVLSLHDSWTLRCDEMLKCSQSLLERLYYTIRKYYEPRYERLVYPRFDRCVVVAERDQRAVQATVPHSRVACIPGGTDTAYFHPLPVEKQAAALAFHGHLSYAPNVQAAVELANLIFPQVRQQMPLATLRIVGASPAPIVRQLASVPGVEVLADPPDVRPALCAARIYVCPIRHGTGLKNKVLEAMAMGLPIVCYPAAAAGLVVQDGQHLLLAKTPDEFMGRVLDLLRRPEEGQRLASAARRLVEEKYSWEACARAFEDLYEQVIAGHRERNETSELHSAGVRN